MYRHEYTGLRFFLGALTPETLLIARHLEAAGLRWQWAHLPFRGGEELLTPEGELGMPYGSRDDSGELEILLRLGHTSDDLRWYRAADLRSPKPVADPDDAYRVEDVAVPDGTYRVWIGCRPDGLTALYLEERCDSVMDTRTDVPPHRSVEGSRIGRLWSWADTQSIAYSNRWPNDLHDRITQLAGSLASIRGPVGAVAYDLRRALSGQTGVSPHDCLRHVAEMAADKEYAHLRGVPTEATSPEAFLAQVETAKAILTASKRLPTPDDIRDLLDKREPIPALTVAAAHLGVMFVHEVDGFCRLDGATTPQAVQAFTLIGREAFAAELYCRRQDAEAEALYSGGDENAPFRRGEHIWTDIPEADGQPVFRNQDASDTHVEVRVPDEPGSASGTVIRIPVTPGMRTVAQRRCAALLDVQRGTDWDGAAAQKNTATTYLHAHVFGEWVRNETNWDFAKLVTLEDQVEALSKPIPRMLDGVDTLRENLFKVWRKVRHKVSG